MVRAEGHRIVVDDLSKTSKGREDENQSQNLKEEKSSALSQNNLTPNYQTRLKSRINKPGDVNINITTGNLGDR